MGKAQHWVLLAYILFGFGVWYPLLKIFFKLLLWDSILSSTYHSWPNFSDLPFLTWLLWPKVSDLTILVNLHNILTFFWSCHSSSINRYVIIIRFNHCLYFFPDLLQTFLLWALNSSDPAFLPDCLRQILGKRQTQ